MKQLHHQPPDEVITHMTPARCTKVTLGLMSLLTLAACGHVHPAGVAMAPNPPPPPGYRASCSSLPLPFNGFITACTPAQSEQVAIVHAKG